MSNESAKELIRKTFQNPFDKERFHVFIKDLLNHIEDGERDHFICQGQYVPEAYRQYIKSYERIGKYLDPEGKKIDILIVNLQKERSLEIARSMQRNFIARYLNGSRGGEFKDAALVAFVAPNSEDWRFSLVKMEYKFIETPNGQIKVKEEFTPARRWSFLVGKNENSHTAQSRLATIIAEDEYNPNLSQLEEAFNIEKVTKEFFEKYRELFVRVKEELDSQVDGNKAIQAEFIEKNISTVDFAKKLLGQIVFLYFLQKKGWFGVERDKEWGTGSKNFLRELFEKKHGNFTNFFNDVLEPLFYEALARERDEDFYSHFNCKIPFLNGGLFDPINNYDWVHTDILIPNEVFSNSIKTKEGDIGNGLLDIFDRYNFTVKEDEPLEKEVAIDPEMLGKVFENLLEVKDRKSKGTYYTPREIVHYMCQQSLINYLYTELNQNPITHERAGDEQFNLLGNEAKDGQLDITIEYSPIPVIPNEDIEIFINYSEQVNEHDAQVTAKGEETDTYAFKMPASILNNSKLIDEKLADIKICDPAAGSGAFLVGLMTEIIRARTYLSSQIGEQYRTRYELKRSCIEQSLYGVDIDPGAVEIAKLRLWLSLVVDEDNIRNIKPLPNLDYKIMCGNSLLGFPDGIILDSEINTKLENRKKDYFDITNPINKIECRKEISTLFKLLVESVKQYDPTLSDIDFDFHIHFSEVFHEKGGFDVVIVNPPYVGSKGHKDEFQKIQKGPLGIFYERRMDLLYFFFHQSLNITKQNACIAFITTNYFSTAAGARKLRQDIKQRAIIKYVINFNELKIFESALGQHNMITILQKAQDDNVKAHNWITQRQGFANSEILQRIFGENDEKTEYFLVPQNNLYDGKELYIRLPGISSNSNNSFQIILEKLSKESSLLGNICAISQGIVTGANKVIEKHIKKFNTSAKLGSGIFVLNVEELINKNIDINSKHVKPYFKNSNIKRYWTNSIANEYILYFKDEKKKQIIEKEIINHFEMYKELLIERLSVCKKNKFQWNIVSKWINRGEYYLLFYPRKQKVFESPKIVISQRSPKNNFGYNEIPWYATSDVYFIVQKDQSYYLKFILSLLNSRLIYFWLYNRGKRKGEILEFSVKPLQEIPIKQVSEIDQKHFVDVVDNILNAKSFDPLADTLSLETKIDHMVYELYGLTEEEIAIVEGKK